MALRLFLAGSFLTAFLKINFYPSLFRTPEMWEEMSWKYWLVAHSGSWMEKFFRTDAGYIPLLARLTALMAELLGLSPGLTVRFYNWSTLGLIAVAANFFCLPIFRSWVKSDWQRFLICLGFSFYENFHTHYFFNAAYFGGMIVFFLLLGFEELSKKGPLVQIAMSGFIALIILSKGLMLVFLPVMLWLGYRAWKMRHWEGVQVLVIPVLAALAQLTVSTRSLAIDATLAPVPLGSQISALLRRALQLLNCQGLHMFSLPRSNTLMVFRVSCWIGLAAFLGLGWRPYRENPHPKLRRLACFTVWLVFAGVLITATRVETQNFCGARTLVKGVEPRWELLGQVSLYLLVAVYLVQAFQARPKLGWGALVILVLSSAYFSPKALTSWQPGWPSTGFGDWSLFADPRRFCLPNNPFPQFAQEECQVLSVSDGFKNRSHHFEKVSGPFPAPQTADGVTVQMLGLAFREPKDSANILVNALGEKGEVLGTARGMASATSRVTFFAFEPPVFSPKSFQISGGLEVAVQLDGQPLSLWIHRDPSLVPLGLRKDAAR